MLLSMYLLVYVYVKTTHICFKIVLLLSTYESMDKYIIKSSVTSKKPHNFTHINTITSQYAIVNTIMSTEFTVSTVAVYRYNSTTNNDGSNNVRKLHQVDIQMSQNIFHNRSRRVCTPSVVRFCEQNRCCRPIDEDFGVKCNSS